MNAEQCKAESTQRALEEQRKVMVQQIAMEREELEKAKVSVATPRSAMIPAVSPRTLTPCPCPLIPECLAGGAEVRHAQVWGGAAAPSGRVGRLLRATEAE